ncbi:MAG: VanZ family protein [Thermoanaerobaculia bacterium]
MDRAPRLRRARIGAIAWGICLLALTSWPKPPRVPFVSDIPDFDKLVHVALYGAEAFFLYASVAWPGRAVFSLARALAVAATMAVWGAADEVHQHWIPGRSMEGEDVLADIAGAALGAVVASLLAKKTPSPSSRGAAATRDLPS